MVYVPGNITLDETICSDPDQSFDYGYIFNKNWILFDRYKKSNQYTNNLFDNLIILNSAINVNINGDLYEKNTSEESIIRRKNLILNDIELYKENNLCNDIQITGFFPHLDVVDSITVKSIQDSIGCYFTNNKTKFYAEIYYSDSCHVSGLSEYQKLYQPYPGCPLYFNLVFKKNPFINDDENILPSSAITDGSSKAEKCRNTSIHPDFKTANYQWTILNNEIQVSIVDGSLTSGVVYLASSDNAELNNSFSIQLEYSE